MLSRDYHSVDVLKRKRIPVRVRKTTGRVLRKPLMH